MFKVSCPSVHASLWEHEQDFKEEIGALYFGALFVSDMLFVMVVVLECLQ